MAGSSLPLLCSICPKKPTFSDVSHLLTHVASKGHLSHYYKTKVKSAHDLCARTTVDAFDAWYSTWNVEELMSQRMHHKDAKKPRPRSQPTMKTRQPNKLSNNTNDAAHSLDPRLGGLAPDAYNNFSATTGTLDYSFTPPNLEPPHPKIYLWDTSVPASSKAIPLDFSSPIPLPRRPDSTVMAPTVPTLDHDNDMAVAEAAKLKGIFWPGMDIFDSATADMRRKRNQKKDDSVLEQLAQNSLQVQPTEVIYYPYGALKKQRKISGRVESSSSPTQQPMPSPLPKMALFTRPALSDRDINTNALFSRRAAPVAMMNNLPDDMLEAKDDEHKRKRKRTVSVYKDRDFSPLGDQSGMRMLTSEFKPDDVQYAPAQYGRTSEDQQDHFAYNDSHFTEAFVSYPSHQEAQQHGLFGPAGFDLCTFLDTHAPTAYQSRQSDRVTAEQPGSRYVLTADGIKFEREEKTDDENLCDDDIKCEGLFDGPSTFEDDHTISAPSET